MNNAIPQEWNKALETLCAEIGSDPLLVQGAGGNASVKTDSLLRVKASGTCLADATTKDIFVDVDLVKIRNDLRQRKDDFNSVAINKTDKKPSIETTLHALMQHRFVLHLHMIDPLSILVLDNSDKVLSNLLPSGINWKSVPYLKPGLALTKRLIDLSIDQKLPDIIFLENHGVVIGGQSVGDIRDLIKVLELNLEMNKRAVCTNFQINKFLKHNEYKPAKEGWMHALSLDTALKRHTLQNWAVYPDHLVFLGPKPIFINTETKWLELPRNKPPFIFSEKFGTLVHHSASKVHLEQLKCFYNVIIRIPDGAQVRKLHQEEINELLNWDAEIFRQSVN